MWLIDTATAANAATATVFRASERLVPLRSQRQEVAGAHCTSPWRRATAFSSSARLGTLRVCNPATGRSQTLPPEPEFHGCLDLEVSWRTWCQYVLLVGDGEGGGRAVGRPFHVAKVNVVLSDRSRYQLEIQTFSSEQGGAWGPYTKIRTPEIRGTDLPQGLGTPLVVRNSAYLLCLTDAASYALELNVRAARVTTVTTMPETFPRAERLKKQHLLATATAGGSPIVLVADDDGISVWAQSSERWET